MEKILVKKDDTAEILALCKANKKTDIEEDKLVFIELGRDMFKTNTFILNRYFKNESGQDCYYANLLYFRTVPKINPYKIKKTLKRDFGKSVSLAGYSYNPEHYRFCTQCMQDEYEEDLFKSKSKEDEEAELEADRRNRLEPVDFNAIESLYTVLYEAIKARLVMLLNLENIPGLINNALDCYYKGVNCSMSNEAMYSKIADIKLLLENQEVVEWLKTKPTDLCFDRFDYVTTYQKVLRQLTDIRVLQEDIDDEVFDLEREAKYWLSQVVEAPSTELDIAMAYQDEADDLALTSPKHQWHDLLHNDEDIYEEEIIANDYPEFETYQENALDDDEDYLANNEIFD